MVAWLPKLVVAIALIIIGGLVANVVGDLVRWCHRRPGLQRSFVTRHRH